MLAGLPAGASRSFVAMVHHGGEAVPVRTLVLRWEGDIRQANCSCLGAALQQSIGTEVFSFSQRFFTHPQENLHREQSCSVKFHIQANKHKTHWEKIPSQALLFASINLSFCLASLLVKKGLWRVPPRGSVFLGCWGYILCQLTAISSIATYPLTTGTLLVCAPVAVTAIFITLFCKFCILHIPLLTCTSSSTKSCKQTAALAAPLSGTLLQITEGRYVY